MTLTVKCYLCGADVEVRGVIPQMAGLYVAQCEDCKSKGRSRLVWGGDPEDDADQRIEQDSPEEVFGPHLGSSVRADSQKRMAFFTAPKEEK